MDENKPFINRRGHRLEPSDEELSSLRIDDEPAPVPTEPAKVPKQMKPRRKRPSFKFSKRAALIVLVIVVGAVLAFVGLGEFVRAQYSGAEAATRDAVGRIAATTTQTKDEVVKASDLDTPLAELGAVQAGLCRGGFLDNATSFYPRAQAALGECNRSKQTLSALIADLQATQQQLAYLEAVERALEPIKTARDGQFAVVSAQLESWQRVGAGLQKLQAPNSMTQVHAELARSAAAIYEGWSAFNKAHNDQNAEAFESTQDTLNTRYSEFRGHATTLQGIIANTQSQLTSSYQNALN